MATAMDIIGRAMRLIGAVDAGETMEAVQAQDAMRTLNTMLAEMHEAGFGFPDYSFDSVTDTIATDIADSDALAYALAIRVAPEYGRPITPEIGAMASRTMYRLRSRYFQPSGPIPSVYY